MSELSKFKLKYEQPECEIEFTKLLKSLRRKHGGQKAS